MITRVLLVDDEPRVLAAMQRLMRSRREEFAASAAVGGAAALEMLDAEPFDVVISDMRMPGMDGAELLARARQRHPGVVRVILSGQTELDVALRAVSLAHQFLSKPCSSEELFSLLRRARGALARFTLPGARAGVVGLGALPCGREARAKLAELLGTEPPSPGEIAEILCSDVGMSTKVLQLVNSAFFGRAERVADPRQAAALLGPTLVREIVRKTEVFAIDRAPAADCTGTSFTERVGSLTRLATNNADDLATHTDRDLGESLLGLWGIAA